MNLISIVRGAQNKNNQEPFLKELFNLFKDYIIKQFIINTPFEDKNKKKEYVSNLVIEFISILKKRFYNFKLKPHYSNHELQEHLWAYFQSILDSIIDRSLVIISFKVSSKKIQQKAYELLLKRYQDLIKCHITQQVQTNELDEIKNMTAYELEIFWDKEILLITENFVKNKFFKLMNLFEKENSTAIFRNYLEQSIKNYLIDYYRGKNVKKMRRLVLYQDDLPKSIFSKLKNLQGHGNLFYYKKKLTA